MKVTATKTKKLMVSAMMLAVATVLAIVCQFIPFLNLPFGGGFTVASMLPVVLVAYLYGTGWGLGAAFTYAVIQMLLGARTVTAFFLPADDNYAGSVWAALAICLIDYVIAYTVLGFGGAFRRMKNRGGGLVLGSILALCLRYLAHIVSGYIFFGAWAEWFFSQEGFYAIGSVILNSFSGNALAMIYSIFYNGLYMIPEIIITAVIAFFVMKLAGRQIFRLAGVAWEQEQA